MMHCVARLLYLIFCRVLGWLVLIIRTGAAGTWKSNGGLTSAADDDPQPLDVTPADLDHMRDDIAQLVSHGPPGAKNALFHALVHEIQVTGRHRIKPHFRVPTSN